MAAGIEGLQGPAVGGGSGSLPSRLWVCRVRLSERGWYRNTAMSVLRWAMGECRRESRNVCTGRLLPGRSARWKGPLEVHGGGSAVGSGINRESRGGSWVGVGVWGEAAKPAEPETRECICNTIINAGNMLQHNGKVVGRCHIKQGPNQVHKGTLLCGAGVPHIHHCLIVTMNQEAPPCPVGAPCGGCGQDHIEFPPLCVLLSLPEGPGTAEPVTCPESPIAKVASIGVQLERRRRCLGEVKEAALAIPV